MAIEPPLQKLIGIVAGEVDDLMASLEAASVTAPAWRDDMASVLARGHLAAYMAGQGSEELDDAGTRRLLRDVGVQLGFLDTFTVEIQEAAAFQRGWNARANLYVQALKIPFWQGVTRLWPLPYMPGEGTQCLGNCGCLWEISELDGEGNADAFWRRATNDSCQTCVERERLNPIRIRDGVLQ